MFVYRRVSVTIGLFPPSATPRLPVQGREAPTPRQLYAYYQKAGTAFPGGQVLVLQMDGKGHHIFKDIVPLNIVRQKDM